MAASGADPGCLSAPRCPDCGNADGSAGRWVARHVRPEILNVSRHCCLSRREGGSSSRPLGLCSPPALNSHFGLAAGRLHTSPECMLPGSARLLPLSCLTDDEEDQPDKQAERNQRQCHDAPQMTSTRMLSAVMKHCRFAAGGWARSHQGLGLLNDNRQEEGCLVLKERNWPLRVSIVSVTL